MQGFNLSGAPGLGPEPVAEWKTQRDRRDQRELQREQTRKLKIEWADKLWLAQNHPVPDSVLAWLSENRSEASKIGVSRWNLETLPALVNRQHQLRTTEEFTRILDRCDVSTSVSGFPQNPQIPQNQAKMRAPRKDRGKARKRPSTTT